MKVLVIGKGGREHALCWKLKQSPRVRRSICARATPGRRSTRQNVAIEPGDFRALIQFAKREGIGLTVVGPEEPLTNGIVDAFQREGLRIFGPSQRRRRAGREQGLRQGADAAGRHPDGRLPDLPLGPRRRALHPLARGLARRPLEGAVDAPPHPALPDRRRDARSDRPDHGPARAARAGRPGRDRGARPAAGRSARRPRRATTSSAGRSAWS